MEKGTTKTVTLQGTFSKIICFASFSAGIAYKINGTDVTLLQHGFNYDGMSLWVGEVNGSYTNPTISASTNQYYNYRNPFYVIAF